MYQLHNCKVTQCYIVVFLSLFYKCRFAGIGGLSEALGWTEVQQESDMHQLRNRKC
jgi:hypothetical protein